MSKASRNYNAQMNAVERHHNQKKASKQGQRQHVNTQQPQSNKPYAYPSKQPKAEPYSSFGKSSHPIPGRRKPSPMPELNCWIAASGMAQNIPMDVLRSFKDHNCTICHRRVDPNRDYFVLHNCSKLIHDGCMRKWLTQFRDRNGRMARPQCPWCRGTMNIRDCGKSRNNPLGFGQFNGL